MVLKKFLIIVCTIASSALAAQEQPIPTSAKPQNGVFFTYTGYETTVLELKDGHFRFWFESDTKSPREPDYPFSGEFTINGDTITLKHAQMRFRTQWAFRTVDGILTLWLPESLNQYERSKSYLDPTRLKRFGMGGILIFTEKPAEDVWKHRKAPSL
jgi:hypothetical protein